MSGPPAACSLCGAPLPEAPAGCSGVVHCSRCHTALAVVSAAAPPKPVEEGDSIFATPPPSEDILLDGAVDLPPAMVDPASASGFHVILPEPSPGATFVAEDPPSPVTNVASPHASVLLEGSEYLAGKPEDVLWPGPAAESSELLRSVTASDPALLLPTGVSSSRVARRVRSHSLRSSLFMALVFVPLVSYAILATIAVIILYLRPQPPDPLERLPDLEGDYRGAKHQKPGAVSYERISPESPLPARLQVSLGQSIRLGDLEITPLAVELRHLKITQPGMDPETTPEPALVLRLRLKNLSSDMVFSPTDPYFDRRWKSLSGTGKPYTFLEFGSNRFFGGPLPWQPGTAPEDRATIEGQQYGPLHPGEEVTTLVCTDSDDGLAQLLASYQGSLLWRIHLRRGLVQVGQKEVCATAVVGVRFSDREIQKSGT